MSALHGYLQRTAAARPHAAAIEADRQSISYGELHALAKSICERLTMLGANRGDRIGVYLPKSIDAVAAMHGIMMSGAAYVPVDPSAPAVRNASIHHDCSVRIVIVHAKFEAAYRQAFGVLGRIPTLIVVPEVERGFGMREAVDAAKSGAQFAQGFDPNPDDLAYILYTSGSTGKPKGVMLTHRNATSFIDWCSEVFAPGSADRCSSHAPFHFDLSVLDIYLTMKHGATLVLVPEATGKDPVALAPFIAAQRISVWYSAPSILGLLAHFGKLAQYDLSPLRLVLFAGEVFPVKHLRALKTLLPAPVYFNLYGPTETNVCTYYRIPDTIPADRTTPYPIGRTCAHLQTTVIDDTGNTVSGAQEGELVVRGPAVMQGYWNLPERTELAFHTDESGRKWYKTGDIVMDQAGEYIFVGRRDRMIKKRGYRIELGEIEACLYGHAEIREAGVVAHAVTDGEIQVVAFISTKGGAKLSIIGLKQFCSEHLPLYMIPDRFNQREALPKTSTDKVNYQQLLELLDH